ncbi:uncharacterized protein [Dysidea avara]|uniref:uncharacterized protein isoform X1 n=1 Tax=Dysidea avara TaxID=196820 RepID=UPI003319B6A7
MQADFDENFDDDAFQSSSQSEDNSRSGSGDSSVPLRKKVHVTAAMKAWKGHYCCVPLCRSSSGDQSERRRLGMPTLSFHSFPDLKTARAKDWIVKIRRDPGVNFKININTKICSLHFKPDDYTHSEYQLPSSKPRLRPTAVPSVFPWTGQVFQRKSRTSVVAISSQQRCDFNHELLPNDGLDDTMDSQSSELQALESKVHALELRIRELENELYQAKNESEKQLFRLENIKNNDELVKLYTGIPDYATLIIFYEEILKGDAEVIRIWKGKNSKDDFDEIKCGRSQKLPLLEQLFMTIVRLRMAFPELDLANRFGVSQSTVSRITMTWINLLYHNFKAIERFPSWSVVNKYMPEVFKKLYPDTRVIIDATEFFIERPSSLLNQACTFSNYKNRNTVKVLIGITPSGAISFVFQSYEGSISDRKLVELSGLLQMLEPGDELMADKGFLIQDLLAPLGVRLNVPPLVCSKQQMPMKDVVVTKKIAQLRVHVERAIGRVKEYRILQGVIPSAMWDSLNEVIYVCCMLTNLSPPLVC